MVMVTHTHTRAQRQPQLTPKLGETNNLCVQQAAMGVFCMWCGVRDRDLRKIKLQLIILHLARCRYALLVLQMKIDVYTLNTKKNTKERLDTISFFCSVNSN